MAEIRSILLYVTQRCNSACKYCVVKVNNVPQKSRKHFNDTLLYRLDKYAFSATNEKFDKISLYGRWTSVY